MIRGGHIDPPTLGGMVSVGDLANWMKAGQDGEGSGSMDLPRRAPRGGADGALREGRLAQDRRDLPITGKECVDLIITDLCVFAVEKGKGSTLLELHDGASLDDVKAKTGCAFAISLPLQRYQAAPRGKLAARSRRARGRHPRRGRRAGSRRNGWCAAGAARTPSITRRL